MVFCSLDVERPETGCNRMTIAAFGTSVLLYLTEGKHHASNKKHLQLKSSFIKKREQKYAYLMLLAATETGGNDTDSVKFANPICWMHRSS